MNVKDILNILNNKFPLSTAESWDNVGLIVGDEKATVRSILIALDPVTSVMNEALRSKVDLIITHHPIMFSPVNTITPKTYDGKIVSTILENKLNLCSLHTNVDYYTNGMSLVCARLLNLTDLKYLIPHPKDPNYSIGIIGSLPFAIPISLESLAEYSKTTLKAKFVTFAGKSSSDVSKVAIIPGSGMEYVDYALEQGADVLITGDIKYHNAIDSVERGLNLIDVGHFELEKMFIDIIADYLGDALIGEDVTLIKSKQKNIFKMI